MKKEMRLIDANALLESIEGTEWYTIRVDGSVTQGAPSEEVAWYKATDIYAAVENAPTVDAVEVVHGEWEKYTDDKFMGYGADGRIRYRKVYSYKCSKCWNYTAVKHNYCPNCGADMRERKDNE